MKREKRPVNFEDSRGTIMDIFVKEPYEHCVIVKSTPDSVRGNHYHKESAQTDFMLYGRMKAFCRKQGSDKIEEFIVEPNDVTYWEKGEVHEFIALEDCGFLSFVNGPRGGDNYENDTYRLKIPLHEQLEKGITDWKVQ